MTLLLSHSGKIGLKNGKLAIKGPAGTSCCCVGCCQGALVASNPAGIPPVVGTVLEAELIEDETGCFGVGNKMDMVDTSPALWASLAGGGVGFFGNAGWRGLWVSCGTNPETGQDVLNMSFETTGACPLIDTTPGGFTFLFYRDSGQCDPFVFEFSYFFDETHTPSPGCNCDGTASIPGTVIGWVRVRVTIKP